MKKVKYLFIVLFVAIAIYLIPNNSNAATLTSRDVYSNNGSMKFVFSNLELDITHEYEFGLTPTAATQVDKWFLITEYEETTATIDISTTTSEIKSVVNMTDTGYITIKDKTEDKIVMDPFKVDLKMPYLKVTNYSVISNGKDLNSNNIQVPLRNAKNSQAYYQYEKVTDQNFIDKYKEIKASNGDYNQLEEIMKTTIPDSNWQPWEYWNGHVNDDPGFGYTQREVQTPDTGLYYMWLYFSGDDIKNIYGCILVDNLEPDIALESISLPKTATVKMGEKLTLKPTFNPSGATNKIVSWESSNEKVATVDNSGNITPVSIGSTVITVTSQDGNKQATCTVTVTDKSNDSTNQDDSNNNQSNENTDNDETVAPGKLPQTGESLLLIISSIIVILVIAFTYIKLRKSNDIK